MSDSDKSNDGPNPSEADEFARLFSNFMRNSFAKNQTPNNQLIETKPDASASYKVDTQPLVVGVKFNGENYPLWAVLMKTAISGRGMVSHVTGVSSPPPKTDPAFGQWQQADHCVFTWLVQNIEPRLVSRISQQPTAKHIWDSLAVTYASGGDGIQVYDLHRRASILRQGSNTLEDVWSTLQELWTAIDQKKPNPMECPKDIERHNEEVQNLRVYQFLTAINDSYESTKREILKIEPLPSVEQAYNMVKREDVRSSILRLGISEEKPGLEGVGVGLASVRDRGRTSHPSNSRSGGNGGGNTSGGWNQRRTDDRRTEKDKLKMLCTYCGKRKHTRENCFELVGFPEWWESKHKAPPPPSRQPWSRGGHAAAAVGNEGGSQTMAIEGNPEVANARETPAATGGNRTGAAQFAVGAVRNGANGSSVEAEGGNVLGLGFRGDHIPSPQIFLKLQKKPHPKPNSKPTPQLLVFSKDPLLNLNLS